MANGQPDGRWPELTTIRTKKNKIVYSFEGIRIHGHWPLAKHAKHAKAIG
jgi:hypothetical protein